MADRLIVPSTLDVTLQTRPQAKELKIPTLQTSDNICYVALGRSRTIFRPRSAIICRSSPADRPAVVR